MKPELVMLLSGSFAAILLGIALVVASAVIAALRKSSVDDTLPTTLSTAGWCLVVPGFLVSCWVLVPVLGVIPGVIVLIVAVEIYLTHRVAGQRAMFGVLATAAERSLPLIPVVKAFAHERRGRFARRARRLAGRLADGVSLPDALARIGGLAPVEALPVIRVGHQSGALAAALRQVAAGPDSRNQLWASLVGKLMYLLGLVAFGVSVLAYVMIFIIPPFRMIFAEFETQPPVATELLIAVSRFLVETWLLFFPILAAVLALFMYAFLRYVGAIRWELPGLEWAVRRLDTAVIFDAMALALGRERPLQETIGALADSYHKPSIRRRLRDVLSDLESGADWLDSFRRHGLLKQADLAVLRAAQRVGNLPWALREMADSNRRRLAYRLYAVLQIAFPLVILACGALVMFFVVSMFLPLIRLIVNLT